RKLAEKYELILNSTEIGVWDWDFGVNKLSWNDIMYSLFEVSKDAENVFDEYEKKLHPDDRKLASKNFEKIMSGEIDHYESEFRIILKDQSIRHLKSITNIERDSENNVTRIYGINIDITKLKESELELIEAKEKAELANKAKSTFLANMSHEIRTPMNAILGFGEILQNNNKDERNQDYITGIIKSGNSLLSLINDILDFSKIEANKMTLNLNSVDIKRVISDINRMFEFTTSRKGIQYYSYVDSELPPYLILDEGKIKQILINLLGNAVKFTESGSISLKVSFSFNNHDTSKLQLTFTIKDSGIGIDKDKLASIFKPFEQEDDNDSRKYEGTGLGLSIVKSIAELHNGKVVVESELGKGSSFIVTIPDVSISLMRTNLVSSSTKVEFNKYDLSNKTVLFAEDIESNRMVVKGFMKDYDIKILFAINGEDALEIARAKKIDLAFIDLHMPIMDGMTMAEIWMKDNELKTIPLIALTAEVYDEKKHLDKDYFKHYLTKPVRGEDIYETILIEMGMKEASEFSKHNRVDEVLINDAANTLLVNNEVVSISTRLLKKLN
ncbi:MAG: ATP-binding protein, partial [Candidatus Kapaibacterium sp.]